MPGGRLNMILKNVLVQDTPDEDDDPEGVLFWCLLF